MLNLFRTVFGIVFFTFLFGVVIIKNGPKEYQLILEQPISYPDQSYLDELSLLKDNDAWFKGLTSKDKPNTGTTNQPKNATADRSKKQRYNTRATDKGFTLEEMWSLSSQDKSLQLQYSFKPTFKGQLYLFSTPSFNDSLRETALKRLDQVINNVDKQYAQHRWDYKGKIDLPLTYYLALEGESEWERLEENTNRALEKIIEFARFRNIPLQKTKLIVYPRLSKTTVQWRAGIKVDRFYKTNSKEIRCRKFKGGNALALDHLGPYTYLNKSWEVLQDSLKDNIQTYPSIQIVNTTSNNRIKNPLKWTTPLYIPILE